MPRKINQKFAYISEDIMLMSNAFSQYISMTEKLINESVIDELKQNYDYISKHQDEDGELSFHWQDHEIKENIANLYYTSTLVSLYSFLEHNMFALCKSVENEYDLKIDNLSGKGIFQFKLYLEKVVGINFEKLNDSWNDITKINKLRNLIVHESVNEVRIIGNQKKINALKEIDKLTIIDRGDSIAFVIRDSKVLTNFLKTINAFFNKILFP